MITISHTFQYKTVLNIFKFQAICQKKLRQLPIASGEQENCIYQFLTSPGHEILVAF